MASGDTLLVFTPFNNEPPSTLFATIDQRNQHPVLDFDQATSEEAVFSAVMPQSYADTTGLTINIWWSASGVAINDVRWDVHFERISLDDFDIDADGFTATPDSVTDTAPTVDGEVVMATITSAKGTQTDSIVAGDLFRIKIRRDHDHADDDMAADAELHAVEIQET